ncbi:MAG: arylsulfatase, partial [Pseudomonas sp.]
MNRTPLSTMFALPLLLTAMALPGLTLAADKAPNILVIMGDDIGWSNIGVYNQGMMAG